jgi:hypothetical protein
MRISAPFFATALGLSASAAATSQSQPWNSTEPVPSFDLPNALPGSEYVPDPFDVDAIRNTLAHYPLAIDGKNFAALNLVFAPNAVANYSAPLGVMTPLSTIESELQSSLAPVMTQHSFGTQVIDVLTPNTAISVTYVTATHFGVGEYTGQIVTAYGHYQDALIRQSDGTWRISNRNFVYMVRSEAF